MKRWIAIVVFSCAACAADENDVPAVFAAVETPPVASRDDAADDPAIWINPADPAASLILGTDKRAGLYAYRLDGSMAQFLEFGAPNNVDLRQGVALEGWAGDLAAATNRADDTIAMFAVDADGAEHIGSFPSALEEPYGICMGVADGAVIIAVTHKTGDVVFYRATAPGAAEEAQRLKLPSQLEGCVFDDANQTLFIGEESSGVWKTAYADGVYDEPAMIIAISDKNGIAADVEGLTIYETNENAGWLLASSQGNNSFTIFDRMPPHDFIGRFAIGAGEAIDGAEETDGIAATSAALGPVFPKGIFVVQDGVNDPAGTLQNFKIVDWREIEAALGLAE